MIPPPATRRLSARNLVLAAFGVAVFCSLGNWQLNRSAERRAELDAFEKASAAAPGAALAAIGADGGYQRVKVTGRYDAGRQILLDNMTHEGRSGYHVLTPLSAAGRVVLVNRGFIAGGAKREDFPDVSVADNEREVVGVAAPYFQPGMRLDAPVDPKSWPRRMVYPTAAQLGEAIGEALPDYQILLDHSEPDGYVRAWRPYGMSPERHLAYAVQWFGLAAAAAGIWLAVTLTRMRRMRTRNED